MKTTAKRLLSAILAAAMAVTSTGLTVSAEDLGIGGVSGITVGSSITVGTSGVSIDKENFPDDCFRSYIFSRIDSDKDKQLSDEEIGNVKSININGYLTIGCSGLESLKGIEYFTELERLDCSNNSISDLDIAGNQKLVYLDCSFNVLEKLDLSLNPNLENVDCSFNNITELNLKGADALYDLICEYNKLLSLDLSDNAQLDYLCADNNSLTSLDLSNQSLPVFASCSDNVYKLHSLSLDEIMQYGFDPEKVIRWYGADYDPDTNSLVNVTANTVTYDYDAGCDCIFEFALDTTEIVIAEINEENFPDENFREFVSVNYDKNSDGILGIAEMGETFIDVSGRSIESLKGIEYFSDLEYLICENNMLTSLDLSKNKALRGLECSYNKIASLDLSGKTALVSVTCIGNEMTSLDVSGCNKLEDIYCYENKLTSLDLSGCEGLYGLWCNENELTSLNLSGCRGLVYLHCYDNKLTSLDTRDCQSLMDLYCSGNSLTSLDLSGNTILEALFCSENQLETIDLSGNPYLEALYCSKNNLTGIDISACRALKKLECIENQFASLDISNNTALEYLWCGKNQLTAIDTSRNTELLILNCERNQITSLDVTNNTKLTCLDCYENRLTSLDVSQNTALTDLNCMYNNITSLDVSKLTALEHLLCSENSMAFIDISNNTALVEFYCTDCAYELSSYSLEELLQYGFDISKTSDWNGAVYVPSKNRLGFIESTEVTYTYDVGNGKSYRFTLIIPELSLPALPEVTASSTMDSVTLNWNEIDMADSYVVYSYAEGELTTVYEGEELSYTVSDLESGTKYSFLVCAVNGKGVSEYTENDVIAISTKRPIPVTPTVKTAVDDKTVILSWEAVPNADSYTIYKYENGKYTKITSTEKTSCSVTDLVNGTEYKFLVRAFNESGGSKFTTADIVAAIPMAKPAKPVVKATVSDGAVTLKWDPVPTAASYAIYRYENGKYTKITATTATSCAVTGLTNGTEYKFLVRAFNAAGGNAFTTADLVAATPVAKPAKPTVTAVSGDKQVALSWKAVPTATYYTVYKYDGGSYIKLASTTGTSYTATGLTNGTTYKFLVRAFNAAGGSPFTTADLVSAAPKAPEPPAKPANVKAIAGDKQVTLSWTASAGAASYTIYKYENSKYVKITSTTKTSYTVTGLTNGTAYKFLVRAFNGAGGSAFTSADLVSAAPKAAPTTVPAKPTVSANVQDKVVTFSWNAVAGATYYKLYSYSNGKYGLIEETTDTSYRLRYLKNGTTYQILVRAFNEKGGSSFTTADLISVTPKAATAVPDSVTTTATVSGGNVILTWAHIPTAFSYTIYKYENGTYTKLGATSDNSFTVKGLAAGKTYKLLVRAFNSKGGNKITSSDLVTITL